MERKYQKIASALRMLSVDMVVKAKSGHQGMPLGMADIATILFAKHLNYNIENPNWINRDRFILSNGHGVALQYSLMYLLGYKDIKLNDLKNFRQLGSKTAGHPESWDYVGIETTTGPLGQGFGNAVGIALGGKLLNKKLGKSVFDYKVYCFVGDGDLMEGISYEAQNFASNNDLNNLIVVYDDNGITIDGPASLSSKENIKKRFEIDGHDFKQIDSAFELAKKEEKKPVIIIAKTVIGKYSEFAGSYKVHGNPIDEKGREYIAKKLKWNFKPFVVPDEIKDEFSKMFLRGAKKADKIDDKSLVELKKFFEDEYNDDYINIKMKNAIKRYAESGKEISTRKAFGEFLQEIKNDIYDIALGSADLTESNVFTPDSQYIRYGIREHFMGACSTGLALFGYKAFCGTFLVFSDYMRPAIRLACMMKQDVSYVFTHDSVGLGEDGPTHQPIEHLNSLRLIPGITVFRPCDAIEAVLCLNYSLQIKTPKVFALSRQNLPVLLDGKINKVKFGAYALNDIKKPSLIIMASGSEVQIALQIAKAKKNVRVVSVPSIELFEKQSEKYKKELLPDNIKKVAIEAGSTALWYKYANQVFGIDTFGKSGKGNDVLKYFGMSYEEIKKAL